MIGFIYTPYIVNANELDVFIKGLLQFSIKYNFSKYQYKRNKSYYLNVLSSDNILTNSFTYHLDKFITLFFL